MSTRSCVYAGACLLLLSVVTSIRAYEDLARPSLEETLEYQVANDFDTGPSLQDLKYFDEETGRYSDSLLDRLLNSQMRESPNPNTHRNQWDSPPQPMYLLPSKRIFGGFFGGDAETKPVKDLTQGAGQGRSSSGVKQPRWKSKKGRDSGRMLCYFKLCAFRSPG